MLEAVLAAMHSRQGAATQIFYETPHRIVDALADVEAVFGAAHRIVLARELTKLYEEFVRGSVAEVRAVLLARDSVRGEMVLLLSGEVALKAEENKVALAEAVRLLLNSGLDEKDALKQVARERGMGKSEAYREWQRSRGRR